MVDYKSFYLEFDLGPFDGLYPTFEGFTPEDFENLYDSVIQSPENIKYREDFVDKIRKLDKEELYSHLFNKYLPHPII